MVLHELCTPRRMFIGRSRVELIRILYAIRRRRMGGITMDYLLKVLFSIAITMMFVQLGLTIALQWDKEYENNQKLKKYVGRFGAFTLGTIGLSVLVAILNVIWID